MEADPQTSASAAREEPPASEIWSNKLFSEILQEDFEPTPPIYTGEGETDEFELD